jgi:chromosome condensin MukBEF ATPase and DNA-binding subunit MukB
MIIKPSKRNTNKHTDKGMQLLETSIDKVGVIESISVTQEGTIISGHARKEIFDKKGMVAKEIKLAENEYPVIVTEIEDNTKEYYEAQILANTTANKNFNLDIEVIEVVAEEYDIEIEEVGVEIEKEEDKQHKENLKELSNMIACTLTDEESEIWLKVKEKIGKLKDKNAIFELIKIYSNENNIE